MSLGKLLAPSVYDVLSVLPPNLKSGTYFHFSKLKKAEKGANR